MKKLKFDLRISVIALFVIVIAVLVYWIWRSQGTSLIYLEEIGLGETGSEVCYEQGMSCLSVTTARIVDSKGEFYGFITPDCDSQVIEDSSCIEPFETEYAIDKVTYTKHPDSKSEEFLNKKSFCIGKGKGKKGIYEYAYCVKK